MSRDKCAVAYFTHNGNRSPVGRFGNLVFHQKEHVLIEQESDEMEGTKAGCTPEGKVSDHHGTKEQYKYSQLCISSAHVTYTPVEGPL